MVFESFGDRSVLESGVLMSANALFSPRGGFQAPQPGQVFNLFLHTLSLLFRTTPLETKEDIARVARGKINSFDSARFS